MHNFIRNTSQFNQFIENNLTNDQFSGLCGIINLKIGVFLGDDKCKQ
jgi:hypothetical protein